MRQTQELRLVGAVNILGGVGSKLVKAGKENVDQLLRALIPLYIASIVAHLRKAEITGGDVSRFWKQYQVGLSGPAAAKAWREHVGYSRRTKLGPMITPNGVKYVEVFMKAPR